MTNREKYVNAFKISFETKEAVEKFQFNVTPEWDSIGHMCLITALEEEFGVEFEPDEIMGISSFEKGIEVLKNKGIEI